MMWWLLLVLGLGYVAGLFVGAMIGFRRGTMHGVTTALRQVSSW